MRCGVGLLALCGCAATVWCHNSPMYVGSNSAGQLTVWFEFWEVEELAQHRAGFPGWLGNEVSVVEVIFNDPVRDLHPVAAGAKLMIEVVAFDPALSLWRPDLSVGVSQAGEQYALGIGGDHFAMRPWWYLDRTHPEFSYPQGVWSAQFKVIDLSGVHGESAVYTFLASPVVPGPGVVLAGVFAPVLMRRRR
ncbi:MAG: hypothetical protein KF866_06160 [Phycisphaeraceae bacterium]|nr:hypothetical protein [Phycisphaeraceae bacterium]